MGTCISYGCICKVVSGMNTVDVIVLVSTHLAVLCFGMLWMRRRSSGPHVKGLISSTKSLEALYGSPQKTATVKVTDYITPHYRRFIEASPFLTLATVGPEGLDCSPRGDSAGSLVRIQDCR